MYPRLMQSNEIVLAILANFEAFLVLWSFGLKSTVNCGYVDGTVEGCADAILSYLSAEKYRHSKYLAHLLRVLLILLSFSTVISFDTINHGDPRRFGECKNGFQRLS